MKKKLSAGTVACFLVLLIVSMLFLVPFVWTFITSVKPDAEIYTSEMHILPQQVSMEHYIHVFTQMKDFGKYFSSRFLLHVVVAEVVVGLALVSHFCVNRLRMQR